MQFICVLDELTKNILISKKYKLLKQESIQEQIVWIFAYQPEIQFDISDRSKYFLNSHMNF